MTQKVEMKLRTYAQKLPQTGEQLQMMQNKHKFQNT